MKVSGNIILWLALASFAPSCGGDDDGGTGGGTTGGGGDADAGIREDVTISETLASDDRFSIFNGIIQSAGLGEIFTEAGPLTLFAPTNDAFNRLPSGVVAGFETEALVALVNFHTVEGERLSRSDVLGREQIDTRLQQIFIVQNIAGTNLIDGSTQFESTGGGDLQLANGNILPIDSVLQPGDFPGDVVEALAAYPLFDALSSSLAGSGAVDRLKSDSALTFFAPNARAFEGSMLASLSPQDLDATWLYHGVNGLERAEDLASKSQVRTLQGETIALSFLNGDDLFINGDVNVTFTNIETENGLIHIIDAILTPPSLSR